MGKHFGEGETFFTSFSIVFSNAFLMANFEFIRNFLDLKIVLIMSTLERGDIHLVYYLIYALLYYCCFSFDLFF